MPPVALLPERSEGTECASIIKLILAYFRILGLPAHCRADARGPAGMIEENPFFDGVMFWPLEKTFAARAQRFFRPHWLTDLVFFLGQYLEWGAAVLALLHFFRGWKSCANPALPLALQKSVSAWYY
jgi:hypothetical protein